MARIRTILKSSKDADGTYAVLLMLSYRGVRSYFSTGFSIDPSKFDESKEGGGRFVQGRGVKEYYIPRKEEDGSTVLYTNKEANNTLVEMEKRASTILKGYNENRVAWSMEQFRSDFINAPKKSSFLRFAEDVVEKEYRDRGQYSTADTVKYTIISLKRFDSSLANRTFQEISPKYLENYDSFCREEGALPGTISIRVRVIKRIFNIAIRDNVVTRDQYPFSNGADDGKYKPPQPRLTRTNQFLPVESLKLLANHTFERPNYERDKHLFLFSFYCMGINWKDMALLTSRNFHIITTAGRGDCFKVSTSQNSRRV